MNVDWTPLETELDCWRDQGLTLPLWWRDDDAISPTPQLDILSDLSKRLNLPVHLAVIPKHAAAELAEYLGKRDTLVPVVHGWAHQNHAPVGEKKSEFRMHRPLAALVADLKVGRDKLHTLFGDDLRSMFVPPWNRIAAEVVAELPAIGFRILSTATPRNTAMAAPGLEQINTHLDPIDWRGTRGLVSPDVLIARTAELLQDRREGRADNAEPFGVLTHHLVHDQDIWTFTEELLGKLLHGPALPWTAPKTQRTQTS